MEKKDTSVLQNVKNNQRKVHKKAIPFGDGFFIGKQID